MIFLPLPVAGIGGGAIAPLAREACCCCCCDGPWRRGGGRATDGATSSLEGSPREGGNFSRGDATGGVRVLGLSASAARGGCDVGGGEGGATRGGCDGPVSSCPLAVETWGLVEATGKAGLLAVGRSGDWCASVGSRDGSKSADGLGGLGAGGGGSMVYEALATLDCNSCPFQTSLCRLEGLGFGSIGCNSCAPFTLASANEEGVRSVAFLRLLGFRIANEACEELTPATHRNGVDHSGFPDLNAAAPVEHSWSGL